MRNTVKKIVTNVFAVCLILMGSVNSLAASGVTVYIYGNQAWSADYDNTDTRSKNYSYVTAQNHSVRPTSGSDWYSKIQARATNGYGLEITDTIILNESAASASNMDIWEGFLNCDMVGFQFRGNTSNDAIAIVSYDGK